MGDTVQAEQHHARNRVPHARVAIRAKRASIMSARPFAHFGLISFKRTHQPTSREEPMAAFKEAWQAGLR
jgi:hypothetical protein